MNIPINNIKEYSYTKHISEVFCRLGDNIIHSKFGIVDMFVFVFPREGISIIWKGNPFNLINIEDNYVRKI